MNDAPTVEEALPDSGRRPSVPVAVVSVFIFIESAFSLFTGAATLFSLGVLGSAPAPAFVDNGRLTSDGTVLLTATLFVVLGVVALVILVGFLLRRRWAWVAAMTMVTLSITLDVVKYFRGKPSYVSMLVDVVLVLALNQSLVQSAFPKKVR